MISGRILVSLSRACFGNTSVTVLTVEVILSPLGVVARRWLQQVAELPRCTFQCHEWEGRPLQTKSWWTADISPGKSERVILQTLSKDTPFPFYWEADIYVLA